MTESESQSGTTPATSPALIRAVGPADEEALVALEKASFSGDRLSRRRMRHWITAENRIFLVATLNGELAGYTLILLHKGTRLARLYSIAIAASARGHGIGTALLHEGEEKASELGRLFMRLEVAQNNTAAIQLYHKMGYREFGTIEDYYEDHQNALRMQKRIRYIPQNLLRLDTPWYAQTTDFSCGPASLMMAMGSLDRSYQPNQADELDIWRESTTIFMTSGHGGCHPVGLALAAVHRHFRAEVYLNQRGTAFIEGVRNTHKKQVLEVVDASYRAQAEKQGIPVHFTDITQSTLEAHLNNGGAAVILISHYRMHGVKTPHWVTITGMDDQCFYLHDPDCSDELRQHIDCRHIPIARQDFEKMTSFGRQRLRTAVLLSR